MNTDMEILVSKDNPSIVKNQDKCIACGYCKRVCENEITVARMYELDKIREPICVYCGQCANMCPTEAITEKFDYLKVKKLLKDKKKTIVFSVAPAVRVALGESFGYPSGVNIEGRIVASLRKLGADYVFDVTFGADLTIMEEAMELVKRIEENRLPMFTSCCPSWVRYAEIFYPEVLPNLSSCKSPISMQGAIIKTYFARVNKIDPKDIVHIVVAPCTSKKSEIKRSEINHSKDFCDTDYAITTRELICLLKEENIDIVDLEDSSFDSPLGKGSSSGVIFGNSGGVAEAALRTAYYYITGKNLKKEELEFVSLRGNNSIKETSLMIKDKEIKVAVCNGMSSAKKLLDQLLKDEVHYDFIEVMNCKGGCMAGGGQPKLTLLQMANSKKMRMEGIYDIDESSKLRLCHENPEIKELYNHFLKEPLSDIAEELLHTSYEDKSYLLGGDRL